MLSDLVRIQAKHSSIIPEVAKSSESGLTSGLPPLVSDARANKFQRDYTGTESNRNSSKEVSFFIIVECKKFSILLVFLFVF